MDALEQEWNNTRCVNYFRWERDRLLTISDWTQANDTNLSSAKVTAWKTYRQELRDLPATTTPDFDENGNLTGVDWPVKPE